MNQSSQFTKHDTNSSIFEKLPADQRQKLNQAIVDRDPPTLKAAYERFRLDKHQISLSAFYRYARRRRSLATARDLAEMTLPDEAQVPDMLPKLLAQRLLDALADESASPRTVKRLTDAWRVAVRTKHDLDTHFLRLAAVKKREKNRDIDKLCNITKRFAKIVKQDNQNLQMRSRIPDRQ